MSVHRRWHRIGLMVLLIVGTDLLSAHPGAFWFEGDQLFVVGIPSERESAGHDLPLLAPTPLAGSGLAAGRLAPERRRGRASPVVAPALRGGAQPLRLPPQRIQARPAAAPDDH